MKHFVLHVLYIKIMLAKIGQIFFEKFRQNLLFFLRIFTMKYCTQGYFWPMILSPFYFANSFALS